MESKLHQKALLLSYFTVGYNILEGIVSIAAGIMAGSIALIGFGLDSFIESLSGGVMIWRFRSLYKMSEEEEVKIEKKALILAFMMKLKMLFLQKGMLYCLWEGTV